MSNASSTSPASLPERLPAKLGEMAPCIVSVNQKGGIGIVSGLLSMLSLCMVTCMPPSAVTPVLLNFTSLEYMLKLIFKAEHIRSLFRKLKEKSTRLQNCLSTVFGRNGLVVHDLKLYFPVVNSKGAKGCNNCNTRIADIRMFMDLCKESIATIWDEFPVEAIIYNVTVPFDHFDGTSVNGYTYNSYHIEEGILTDDNPEVSLERVNGKRFKCMLYREML